ncbi:DUF3365 domain-containing protein [Cryomorpha ignava]|uniref:DUF3365 domain-containing protein n=1 Tax=Cryomorpha ignava TaxID=101383 RepID=A0A7K3WU98_9FLAO|nr:DUF3365 domain-containing protein [Cryomorpha ignava]NEN25066.1 DUF3365 domain-containing protein [Cryomorpha ignava]
MRNKVFALFAILVSIILYSCAGGGENNKNSNVKLSPDFDLDQYTKAGKQYADSAQKMLGMNLKMALAEGGAIGALNFCSIRAISITDSAAKMMNVDLQRVSDKPRNPMNTADIEELKMIGAMKNMHDSGKSIDPIMVRKGNGAIGYYPIIIQPFCLQCHGIPGREINPETAAVIAQLYPVDKAIGYEDGDLRGMWKVTMSEN